MSRRIAALVAATLALAGLTTATTAQPAEAAAPRITLSVTGKTTVAPGEWTWLAATYTQDGAPASASLRLEQLSGGTWTDTGRTLTVTRGTGGRGLSPSATATYRVRTADGAATSGSVTLTVAASTAAAVPRDRLTAAVVGRTTTAPGEWTWVSATYSKGGKPASGTARVQERRDGVWVDTPRTIRLTNGTGGRGLDPRTTTTYRLLDVSSTLASAAFTITVKAPTTPTSPAPAPAPTPTPTPPPASGSVGLPRGTTLKVHDGDLTISKDGTVVSGLDIRGFVRVKAEDVVIKNSIIRGPATALTAPMALVQSDAGASTNLVIQDTTIYAQKPSRFVDGIVGMGFTLERVDIHTVVDQVKVIGDNVLVKDSHLHDNLFYEASGSHDETHDDNVQVATGSNVRVIGSRLEDSTNAAVMITQDRGSVKSFRFERNEADGGACTVNIAEKSYGPPPGLTITQNTFGNGQRHAYCAVLLTPSSQAKATITGNAFADGTPFKVSRGS